VFTALAFLSASPVFGWGDKGHITVASIADLRLTPAVRKGIENILGSQKLTDPRTATWADRIRPLSSFKKIFPNNDQWHFIDTPYKEDAIDLDRDGKEANNVVTKVGEFQKMIADAGQDKLKRRDALLFVIHFVGDMHQPLHCIDRNDRGGNQIEIKINGHHQRESNLHGFWDTTLVTLNMEELEIPDFAARLNDEISSDQRNEWEKGAPLDWANESHQLAKTTGYMLRGKELPVGEVVDLDDDYVKAGKTVVREQLKKAGVRLAKVLNSTFDGSR
jgi:hypothetical protein